MDLEKIQLGLEWYVVFLVSLVCHEAAHALAALRLGDSTAYEGGHVSLDPTPHIRREPLGTVVVPVISFLLGGWMLGWASAPYNPAWAAQYPRRAAAMAFAGPLANLALLLVGAAIIHVGIAAGFFEQPDSIGFTTVVLATESGVLRTVAELVSILFTLNLILAVFNLLPLPPLDGSAVLQVFLSEDTARRYQHIVRNPMWSILGLLVAWKIFGPVFRPIHVIALNLLYPGSGYH
jgi:Zn-dependent protease